MNQETLKQLKNFEQEEIDLIKIYQSLAAVEEIDFLPAPKRREYQQGLKKLLYDSARHQAVVKDLIEKYE